LANEQFIDRAITNLASYISSNLATKLRAVETAQSLTTNSLTDPVAVVKARIPFDNRSPLVEVFDQSWSMLDHINKLQAVNCTVAISHICDANLENGEIFMRRYMTALINVLQTDSTLGGTVTTAILTDGSSAVSRGDTSTTRMIYTQGVSVHVHEGGN